MIHECSILCYLITAFYVIAPPLAIGLILGGGGVEDKVEAKTIPESRSSGGEVENTGTQAGNLIK